MNGVLLVVVFVAAQEDPSLGMSLWAAYYERLPQARKVRPVVRLTSPVSAMSA